MTDFALARRNMIDGQLRPNRVTNTQLLAVIAVPAMRFDNGLSEPRPRPVRRRVGPAPHLANV